MRNLFIVLSLLSLPLGPAVAQVSIQLGLPSVSIGINQPAYPRLVQVPGYPVYYAPGGTSNYFFYDGMYWVYQRDSWYASSWFNGPWSMVAPQAVPAFILRVPVRYYRSPPPYFQGWRRDAPPRWGEHWGNDWARQNAGWDRWNHGNAPRPAPLPTYQKQYSGTRYPQTELQQSLHGQNYRHEPRDAQVRQVYDAQGQHHGLPPSRQSSLPSPHVEPGMADPHAQNDRGHGQDGGHGNGNGNGKSGDGDRQGKGHD
jgi:hypothetical protein